MAAAKFITIGESEQKAKELLSAISRLEKKFPELREVNSATCAVRPRFAGICKPVTIEELDRRGSLIGGMPFLSPEYPEPKSDFGRREGRQFSAGMSPLAQLDLDQISDCIGEDIGSGLLQVWMWPGLWSPDPSLGDLETRLVPRDVVDNTDVLFESSIKEDAEWFKEKAAELEVLKLVDPKRAKENEEIFQEHRRSGMDGLDWTLSEFSDFENWNSIGRFGAPQQIVDWQPAGYTIPMPRIDPSIWDLPDDFSERFPTLNKDPDYKIVCDIIEGVREHPFCALFDVYYDFYNTLYGNELYYGDESVGWSWRPLFAFPGPLSNLATDEHVIFYRVAEEGFEYAAASVRWNF